MKMFDAGKTKMIGLPYGEKTTTMPFLPNISESTEVSLCGSLSVTLLALLHAATHCCELFIVRLTGLLSDNS